MSIVSNAENLQINTAGIFYHFFILAAMCLYVFLFYFAIWDMNIFWVNIYMIKKIDTHKTMVTLQCIIGNGIILIKVECNNIFEAQLFFFVHSDQLSI